MEQCKKLLDKLGMKISLKGYTYWAESMNYLMELGDDKQLLYMCEVYRYIAKKYSDTPSRVERALRHAIETTPEIIETIKLKFNIDYKLNNNRVLLFLVRMLKEEESNASE